MWHIAAQKVRQYIPKQGELSSQGNDWPMCVTDNQSPMYTLASWQGGHVAASQAHCKPLCFVASPLFL